MATTNKNFRVKNGLDVNGEINAAAVGGDEGGQINLAKPATGTTLSGNVAIDIYQDKIRIFDAGGSNRGAYIDLSTAGTGVSSNLLATGGGSASNSFETISANGTSVVADSSTDTLTITPGDGLSITGNATSDTITFTPNVAGASANGIVTTGTQTFAGEKTFSNTITANANIVANTGFVSADTFRLDTTYSTGSVQAGEFSWNNDDGTADLRLKDGDVVLQIGQEQVTRVENQSGATLPEGSVVAISGASGQRIRAVLANASTESTSTKTFGIVTHSGGIAHEAEGYVTVFGLVRGIDTTAYNSGDALWLSNVAGQLTATKPVAPIHSVFVGWVVSNVSSSAGSIFVNVQNGYEVDELHDVKYTSLATDDILQRTTNNLWENKTLAGANIANLAAATVTFAGNVVATTNVNATTFNGNVSSTNITSSILRLTSADDVTLTSTTHAFQIGSDDGQNLRIDSNEVSAYNNGVVSDLNFNYDGGPVVIGGSGNSSSLTVSGEITAKNVTMNVASLATSGTIDLDFSTEAYKVMANITGTTTFTASNYAAGRTITVKIYNGSLSTTRTINFPAGWVFVGAKPANVAATLTGILTVTSFGTTEADCVAAWAVST